MQGPALAAVDDVSVPAPQSTHAVAEELSLSVVPGAQLKIEQAPRELKGV